jgi:hypothetical protein
MAEKLDPAPPTLIRSALNPQQAETVYSPTA